MKSNTNPKIIELTPEIGRTIQVQKSKKKKNSEKAVQVLFKTLSQNKYRLHESIDRKAQILVSVNAIILSILLGTSFAQNIFIANNKVHLSILLASTMISTVFAIMAIKPFILRPAQMGMKENKLLNYAAIAELDIDTYKNKINKVVKSKKRIYESMSEDIFFIGKNIKLKYRMLKLSSAIFLAGLLSSAIIMMLSV